MITINTEQRKQRIKAMHEIINQDGDRALSFKKEGLTNTRIANLMGIPESVVRTLLKKAIEKEKSL